MNLKDMQELKNAPRIETLPPKPPEGLRYDQTISEAGRAFKKGDYQRALSLLDEADRIKGHDKGLKTRPWVETYVKARLALNDYDRAERLCRELIDAGLGCDNRVMLGDMLRMKGDCRGAVSTYTKGLSDIGLRVSDTDGPPFPVDASDRIGAFRAFCGLGECYLAMGKPAESARMFGVALRLHGQSPVPFLGLGKLLAACRDFEQAEAFLNAACGEERPVRGSAPLVGKSPPGPRKARRRL